MSDVTVDLSGRAALVTGASDGVGVEIARGLAERGARVLMPVRNREKGERAIARIRETVPEAELELRDLDLARLSSVAALADTLVADGTPIDLLVLNAGIVLLGDPERHVTEDGFELHFQTNFLGHTALVSALMPLLRASHTRVVVQVSYIAAIYGVQWGDLQSERRYAPLRAYGSSKVALGLWANELARRSLARGWGLRVDLAHPGIAPDTGIAPAIREKQIAQGKRAEWASRFGGTPAEAAQPALLAATTDAPWPGFYGPSGFMHFGGPASAQRPYRRYLNTAEGGRIWDLAEELTATGAIADEASLPSSSA